MEHAFMKNKMNRWENCFTHDMLVNFTGKFASIIACGRQTVTNNFTQTAQHLQWHISWHFMCLEFRLNWNGFHHDHFLHAVRILMWNMQPEIKFWRWYVSAGSCQCKRRFMTLMQHVSAGSWQLADLDVSDLDVSDLTGKKLWPTHLPSNGPSLQDAPVSRRHNRKDVAVDCPRTCRTLVLADLTWNMHAWRPNDVVRKIASHMFSWNANMASYRHRWENCFTHDMLVNFTRKIASLMTCIHRENCPHDLLELDAVSAGSWIFVHCYKRKFQTQNIFLWNFRKCDMQRGQKPRANYSGTLRRPNVGTWTLCMEDIWPCLSQRIHGEYMMTCMFFLRTYVEVAQARMPTSSQTPWGLLVHT